MKLPVGPEAVRPEAVVVGAGMAGLAAAESLARSGWCVTVAEATGRPGGVLATDRGDGWLVERSADNFLATRPEAVELVERIGLGEELVGVAPNARRALVWHRGRTLPAPTGFRLLAPGSVAGILGTPLLSPLGRLRVLAERLIPARPPVTEPELDDESLESFALRRLGREAFAQLVQPLAAGIWTADPARLGMAAACPEFFEMERSAGSLWAGERARLRRTPDRSATGARYGQFLTLASGIDSLPRGLQETLQGLGVRFITARVTALARSPDGWSLSTQATSPVALDRAAGVVLAVPAFIAAELVRELDPELGDELAAIEYAGSAVVSLGFARGDVDHPLDAAGLVVPRSSQRRALAVSFSSVKFPGRAPDGHVLLRVFLGGALDPGVIALDDRALVALARTEVGVLLGAHGKPRLESVARWHGAMPQYYVGHVARVARIEGCLTRHRGLALAGAAYRGVGIPQVIASGQAAAAAIVNGWANAQPNDRAETA